MVKFIEKLFKNNKNKIAIIDDDPVWLKIISSRYEKYYSDVVCETFNYNIEKERTCFLNNYDMFDYLIIDHDLGGTNGANIARNLIMKQQKNLNIFVVSSKYHRKYKGFKCYIEKSELLKDLDIIFNGESDCIDKSVEFSILGRITTKEAS